jgi:hypothetical protein
VLAQLQFYPGLNDTRTILRLNPSRVRSTCTSQEFKVSWFWSKFLPQAQYYPEVRGMDWTLTLLQMGWSHGTSFLKGSMEVYLAYDPGIHCTSISASPENILIGWRGRRVDSWIFFCCCTQLYYVCVLLQYGVATNRMIWFMAGGLTSRLGTVPRWVTSIVKLDPKGLVFRVLQKQKFHALIMHQLMMLIMHLRVTTLSSFLLCHKSTFNAIMVVMCDCGTRVSGAKKWELSMLNTSCIRASRLLEAHVSTGYVQAQSSSLTCSMC